MDSPPMLTDLWDALTLPVPSDSESGEEPIVFQSADEILQSILHYTSDASHVYRGQLHVDMGRYTTIMSRAIHIVALSGRADVMAGLLSVEGIDVNVRDGKGVNALHMSVIRNFPEIAKQLLSAKGIRATAAISKNDPDKRFYETKGLTALHLAVLHNYARMVPVLMNYSEEEVAAYNEGREAEVDGSRPSLRTELELRSPGDRRTPLLLALLTRRQHYQQDDKEDEIRLVMVRELLEAGCDPLAEILPRFDGKPNDFEVVEVAGRKYRSRDCLQLAVCLGFDKCAALLTEYCPFDLVANDLGGPSIIHAIASKGMVAMVPIAVAAGCNVNNINNNGDTVLHTALRYCTSRQTVKMVPCLLDHGAKPVATKKGCLVKPILNFGNVPQDALKLLIEHGADVNKFGEMHAPHIHGGITHYHSDSNSFFLSKVEYTDLLLDNGLDVDGRDQNNHSLFEAAVGRNELERALLLIQNGCDPRIPYGVRTRLMNSPHFAAYAVHICKYLDYWESQPTSEILKE